MILTSLGRVPVPASGTPVVLTTNLKIRVNRLILQTAPTNTGKTYFGLKGMTKSNLNGVSRVLAPVDSYEISAQDGTDGITLSQLAIDADVSGEAMLISYWTE